MRTGHPDAASGTREKRSLCPGVDQCPTGQTTATARPTTASSATVPSKPASLWKRESPESARWSPSTKRRPAGTRTRNSTSDGLFPARTYGSSTAWPLTVTRPRASQQATVSPPTPTTRLIRSFSSADGSRPMNASPFFSCRTGPDEVSWPCSSAPSHPPGSRKTTTSPRCTSAPNHGVSLSTTTRSPMRSVSSIDPEGITNACTKKVFRTRAMSSAAPRRSGISRNVARRLRRATRRARARRPTRPTSRRVRPSASYVACASPTESAPSYASCASYGARTSLTERAASFTSCASYRASRPSYGASRPPYAASRSSYGACHVASGGGPGARDAASSSSPSSAAPRRSGCPPCLPMRRGGRRGNGRVGVALLEAVPAARWPDHQVRPATYGGEGDHAAARRTEVVARVGGVRAVVAEDEEASCRDHDVEGDVRGRVPGVQEGLGDRLPVDREPAVLGAAPHPVTPDSHDALDVVAVTEVPGAVEDHDVAAARLSAETVRQFVDHDTVADVKRGFHRRAGNPEGLRDEAAHEEQDDDKSQSGDGPDAAGQPGQTRARPLHRPVRRLCGRIRYGGAVALRVLRFGVHGAPMLSGGAVGPSGPWWPNARDRPAARARSALALLLDLRGLAAQLTEVVELGATDVTARHQLDLLDDRGVHGEGALHADGEGDLADREGLADARALAADDNALELLHTRAVALDDAHVDVDGVAGAERREVAAQRRGVDGVEQVGHVCLLPR
ncbi:putative signal peptidase I [Streptomyces sp. Tu6071]|nr:putative signal peptidase I [Streptomyces sp. Tu6071]